MVHVKRYTRGGGSRWHMTVSNNKLKEWEKGRMAMHVKWNSHILKHQVWVTMGRMEVANLGNYGDEIEAISTAMDWMGSHP